MTAFVLACDDKYIPFTAVVARRIARHATEKFPIIVVSDGVSDENKALAQKFCDRITFIEAASVFGERDLPVSESFSRAAHLRLFLDEILSDFDRAVYLDSDISPLTDVSPLLAVTPKSAPIIAAHDLHVMIEKGLPRAPQDVGAVFQQRRHGPRPEGDTRGAPFPDSPAIRTGLSGALPACGSGRSERGPRWPLADAGLALELLNYMSERLPRQPFIRHFAGSKPWLPKKLGVEPRFAKEWRSDLAESPWPGRFHEQTFKYRALNALRPTMSAVRVFRQVAGLRQVGRQARQKGASGRQLLRGLVGDRAIGRCRRLGRLHTIHENLRW